MGECICYKEASDTEFKEVLPAENNQSTQREEEISHQADIDEMNRTMRKVLDFQSELDTSCIAELQEMEKMGLPTYFLNSPWDKEEDYNDDPKHKVQNVILQIYFFHVTVCFAHSNFGKVSPAPTCAVEIVLVLKHIFCCQSLFMTLYLSESHTNMPCLDLKLINFSNCCVQRFVNHGKRVFLSRT